MLVQTAQPAQTTLLSHLAQPAMLTQVTQRLQLVQLTILPHAAHAVLVPDSVNQPIWPRLCCRLRQHISFAASPLPDGLEPCNDAAPSISGCYASSSSSLHLAEKDIFTNPAKLVGPVNDAVMSRASSVSLAVPDSFAISASYADPDSRPTSFRSTSSNSRVRSFG